MLGTKDDILQRVLQGNKREEHRRKKNGAIKMKEMGNKERTVAT